MTRRTVRQLMACLGTGVFICCGGLTTPTPPPTAPPPIDNTTILPGPPLPDSTGCEGDELVRPTGRLRLLGSLGGFVQRHTTLSSTDTAIYVSEDSQGDPFFAFDRATGIGKPVPVRDRLNGAYVSQGWLYGTTRPLPQQLFGGTLMGDLSVISLRPYPYSYGLSAMGPVVAFRESVPEDLGHIGWHDMRTSESGELVLGCWTASLAMRGNQLVVVEELVPQVPCAHGPTPERLQIRVHFVRGSTDRTATRTLDLPADVGSVDGLGIRSFDATGHQAIVTHGNNVHHFNTVFHRDGTVETELFPEDDPNANKGVVTAGSEVFAAVRSNDVASEWNVMDIHLPDHVRTDRGKGHGSIVGNFHDKYGAYWVSVDNDGTMNLWTIDFEFLGCPAD